MRLRSITQHVKDQNWFAVGIDFFIVVFGVLIGLQAQQWIENRNAKSHYRQALDRLESEIQSNLETVHIVDEELKPRLAQVTNALDVLVSCEDTPENRDIVNKGAQSLIGTMGLTLRMSALEELTRSPKLLTLQSTEDRKRFSDLRYKLGIIKREMEFIEFGPLESRPDMNPLIKVGTATQKTRIYQGYEWTSIRRKLQLTGDLKTACDNNDLIKSLNYWEKWQGEIFGITNILKNDLNVELDYLQSIKK